MFNIEEYSFSSNKVSSAVAKEHLMYLIITAINVKKIAFFAK